MYEYTLAIRNIITRPRRKYVLLRNNALWNQLLSCLDVIEDSQEAIKAYSAGEFGKNKGEEYLAIYGLLQAIYVQQDAVRNLGESLKIPIELKNYPTLMNIREIRNDSIGHPTKRDPPKRGKKGDGGKGKSISYSYHFISQTTLCRKGFQLHSYYADGELKVKDILIINLIADQKKYISEILISIVNKLEQEEAAHKEKFRAEKLASIFPNSLDYHFQKLLESTEREELKALGLINLQQIKKSLQDFRETLAKRGIELEACDSIKYVYQQIEYPLSELERFFQMSKKEKDANINEKAAYIYAFFLEKQVDDLRQMAREIDEDYSK